jgi:biotin transport system substrate-specific component
MPSISSSRALATAVWPSGVNRAARAIVLVLAGTAILAISAKIKVPFWPVPMTLQTLAVLLIGAAYGSRLAVATVVAYIAEGMLGLPVFTNTPPAVAGPLYMLGPTAGFIVSWVLVAAIVGFASDRGWDRSPLRLGAAMLIAVVVQFAMGFAWLAWFAQLPNGVAGIGMAKAFAGGVAPFLLGDALKVVLAALLIPASWTLVDRRR